MSMTIYDESMTIYDEIGRYLGYDENTPQFIKEEAKKLKEFIDNCVKNFLDYKEEINKKEEVLIK